MRLITFFILFSTTISVSYSQGSQNIDLLYNWKNDTLAPSTIYNNTYNEVWGVVQKGVEYAIIGSTWGTHIFDVSDPANSSEILSIEGKYKGPSVVHRDYHDYKGYLYIAGDEGQGINGLRILDLQYLPDSAPTVYFSSALFSRSHNIFIDTLNAKLYTSGGENNPGVRVFSLADPINPVEVSSVSLQWNSHDLYVRNDTTYINDGDPGMFIYDFSDNSNPELIGSISNYQQAGYNHSGWLSDDGKVFIMGDETHGKQVKLVDVSDLSNLSILSTFGSQIDSTPYTIPHNVMIKGDLAFISYYFDGIVVYNIADPYDPILVGYYDTSTQPHANSTFEGCWGVYPFLPSGIILASDMQNGLFVLDATTIISSIKDIETQEKVGIYPNPFNNSFVIFNPNNKAGKYQVFDAKGGLVNQGNYNNTRKTVALDNLPSGTYIVKIKGNKDGIKMIKN